MRQFLLIILTITMVLMGMPVQASKIQQQGIKTAADCTAAGAALGSCLPLDSQIWLSATTPPQQLSTAITAGAIGGGGGNSGKNYLSNSSFESNSGSTFSGWTVSGATASANTTNFHDQSQSISLALSAGGSLIQDVTPTTNLQGTNLEMGMWVNIPSTISGTKICPRINGATLTGNACQTIGSGSGNTNGVWSYVSSNTVGPVSGTSIGVALVWTATTGTILADQAYVGGATNTSSQIFGVPVKSEIAGTSAANIGGFAEMTGAGTILNSDSSRMVLTNDATNGIMITVLAAGAITISENFSVNNTSSTAQIYKNGSILSAGGVSGWSMLGSYGNVSTQTTGAYSDIANVGDTYQIGYATNLLTLENLHFSAVLTPSASQVAVQSQCASTGSCVNHLSAYVNNSCTSSPCTIVSQNVPWLSSITRSSTGVYFANFTSSFFTNPPSCNVMPSAATAILAVAQSAPSATSFQFTTATSSSGTATDSGFYLSCDKQGTDISSMSAPILIGSLTTNATSAWHDESAQISSAGVVSNASSSWLSCSSTSPYSCTMTGFSAAPNCFAMCAYNAIGAGCGAQSTIPTASAITVNTYNAITAASQSQGWTIHCMGPR